MTDFASTIDQLKQAFTPDSNAIEVSNADLETTEAQVEKEVYTQKAVRVNLLNYAKNQSIAHRGYAGALSNLLNEIRCGHLIDETSDLAAQEKHLQELDSRILEFSKEVEQLRGEQSKIVSVNMPKLKDSISLHEKTIHELELSKHKPADKDALNKFVIWKYGIMMVLGLIFLSMFYISSVYMGMIRNIMEEAQNGQTPNNLFSAIFSVKAFQVFNFHYFAPILIFMFALVLDHYWEKDRKTGKYLTTGVLIFITLLLDGIIAYKIEKSNYDLKVLSGLEQEGKNNFLISPDFWIVIIMGFIATIFWSMLVGLFKVELSKTNTKKVIELEQSFTQKQIDELKKQVEELELKNIDILTKIRQLEMDIKKLSDRKQNVKISLPELERYIAKAYDGWMQVVTVLPNMYDLRKNCEEVYRNFVQEYLYGTSLSTTTEVSKEA